MDPIATIWPLLRSIICGKNARIVWKSTNLWSKRENGIYETKKSYVNVAQNVDVVVDFEIGVAHSEKFADFQNRSIANYNVNEAGKSFNNAYMKLSI
jgi:hypothetical protein